MTTRSEATNASASASAEMERYARANAFINESLIRIDGQADPSNRSRRDLMGELLPLIGHPERCYPAIHVAGTSGKGSVSTLIAHILHASGLRTGLHVSPYVQVATEKLWVDGNYASVDEYVDLVRWIRPIAERLRSPQMPLHGLSSVALCLEHFRRRGVAVAVMEAGVGGRRDITTVVNTRVAVVTNVGLDHQKTLGPTLPDIAWHKVGIIRPGCRAVVLARSDRDPLVQAAHQAAVEAAAPLRHVRPVDFAARTAPDGTVYLDFKGERLHLRDAPLAMTGRVQADNAAIALAACEELDPEGRWVTRESARAGLASARLPARQEWILPHERYARSSPPCPLLLDGAHNDDKLVALLDALDQTRFDRIHLVYGAMHTKQTAGALDHLAARVSSVVVTEPQVYGKTPRPATEAARGWTQRHEIDTHVERDPRRALSHALNRARPTDLVVVAGSFYLAGGLRGRWYPDEAVLKAQNSWPQP